MANPYTGQTISGYNSAAPSDDGSTTSANEITWAKHKTKLGDPVKTLTEAIDTELTSAFGLIFGQDITANSSTFSVVAGDQGKFFSVTGTSTVNLLAAATAGTQFPLVVSNDGTGNVTLDPNGAETINGSATWTLLPGQAAIITCDGSAWRGVTFVKTDSSGNVGVGITPETWISSITALQLGGVASLTCTTAQAASGVAIIGNNVYDDGTAKYIVTDQASRYYQTDGTHVFQVAAAGSADAAITWVTALTLDVSGNAVLGQALNEVKGADIASATTTDIGAATGNLVDITGSVTITGFGTVQAGTKRTATFTGAPLLTYNATSVILPGNANIQAAAGDVATFISLGSGNWICTNYQRDSYAPDVGIWTLITSGSVASANDIPITGIAAGYRELLFVVEGVYSNDNGHTWNVRMGDGSYSTTYIQDDATSDTEVSAGILTSADNSTNTYNMSCRVTQNGLSMWKQIEFREYIENTTVASTTINTGWKGYVALTTEIDQIQLRAGTTGAATIIAAGNYYLYGLK